MIVAIANYLLAQLMAMGRVLEGLAPDDPSAKATAFVVGIILLALIIVVYESLGGFRAVAWTDVIQGAVLMVGFFILLAMVISNFGSIGEATDILVEREPSKVSIPDAAKCREWASYIILVGLGGALYPQAIQRIYAARSATTLRRTLIVMSFLPLTTTLIAVIVGVIGSAHVLGLSRPQSDTILFRLCREVQEQSVFGYGLVVVLFSAVLAAIMSTADSVLLSISSMITKDIYAAHLKKSATEKQLTHFGKICSWILITILVIVAIRSRGTTLVKLLDQKFNLLIQLSPAFILGLNWQRLQGRAVFVGLLAGIVVSVAVEIWLAAAQNFETVPAIIQYGKLFGMHAGIYGFAANLLGLFLVTILTKEKGSAINN